MAYAGGFAGKILVLNLTDRTAETISSEPYQELGGGVGMGYSVFWDLCEDKTVDGFDPGNVVVVSSGAFAGSGVPSGGQHTQVCGLGVYQWPKTWFTRSGFGGRFGAMLKWSGYDAVAITGAASEPVWVNVVNDKVVFESAADLWGLGTKATQEEIWKQVGSAEVHSTGWVPTGGRDAGRSTQKPAVLCIGPAGENQSRIGALVHDAGCCAGQGGFGGIWGAKNLKAISFLGTGSVPIADPNAVIQMRIEQQELFGWKVDEPHPLAASYPAVGQSPQLGTGLGIISLHPGVAQWAGSVGDTIPARPKGCLGCFRGLREVLGDGVGNDNHCVESIYYSAGSLHDNLSATDLCDDLGINAYNYQDHTYLLGLYKEGIVGPGKAIDSNLPWDQYGSLAFAKAFLESIAYQTDVGADLSEGTCRAIEKWGRLEDLATGRNARPQYGYHEHYDPRLETDWSYGAIFSSRDRNEHAFNFQIHWGPTYMSALGDSASLVSAEEMVTIMSEATGLSPLAWDYSEEGIYSDERLEAVQWLMHYDNFWLQSVGLCDWCWPQFINYMDPADARGNAFDRETEYWKAVTGEEITKEQSLERGRKIAELERAIHNLQGRTREDEIFTDYVFDVPTSAPYFLTCYIDGAWTYDICLGRTLDRAKFETVKDRYYALEGWDQNGRITRETLSAYGLDKVADALDAAGVLGEA